MGPGRVIYLLVRFFIELNWYWYEEPLSPAIRFVLSDVYTSMSKDERQSFLHESVSTTNNIFPAFGASLKFF